MFSVSSMTATTNQLDKALPPKPSQAGPNGSTTPAPPFRPMTLHDRYEMMRQNLGRPHGIFWIVTYATDNLPSRASLEERVVQLQDKLPWLYVRVVNPWTNKPGYLPGPRAWLPGEIVRADVYSSDDVPAGTDRRSTSEKEGESAEAMKVLRTEMERFEGQDFTTNPMWSISLVTTSGSKAYLLLSFNHLIIDGRGTQRFLAALLAENIDTIAAEPFGHATRYDDTVSLRPSISFLAPIAWREYILPRLPKILHDPFTKNDCWPGPCPRSPLDVEWAISLATLPAQVVADLKVAAKKAGIPTLHPVLKLAYCAALWAVFRDSDGRLPRLTAGTARDERNTKLGHSYMMANYVCQTECEVSLTGREIFFDSARQLSKHLNSPSALEEGHMTIGLLGQIPTPTPDPTSESFDPRRCTAWERYFDDRAKSATPFRDSLSISNLAYSPLPKRAEDAIWAQTASPFAPALHVNMLGHEGGIRLTTMYHDGAAASRAQICALHSVWERVLERCAAGEGARSVAELVGSVASPLSSSTGLVAEAPCSTLKMGGVPAVSSETEPVPITKGLLGFLGKESDRHSRPENEAVGSFGSSGLSAISSATSSRSVSS